MFQTRPVAVEARQYLRARLADELIAWVNAPNEDDSAPKARAWLEPGDKPGTGDLFLNNRKVYRVDISDWIIRHLGGQFTCCKPHAFLTLYQRTP